MEDSLKDASSRFSHSTFRNVLFGSIRGTPVCIKGVSFMINGSWAVPQICSPVRLRALGDQIGHVRSERVNAVDIRGNLCAV